MLSLCRSTIIFEGMGGYINSFRIIVIKKRDNWCLMELLNTSVLRKIIVFGRFF